MTNGEVTIAWLNKAQDDLEAAELLSNHYPKKVEIICFLAQQAAEKALKAILVDNKELPEKTHVLENIIDSAEKYVGDLSALRPKALFLTPYAVENRYPNELYIDDNTADMALQYASEIMQHVRQCLSHVINEQSNRKEKRTR